MLPTSVPTRALLVRTGHSSVGCHRSAYDTVTVKAFKDPSVRKLAALAAAVCFAACGSGDLQVDAPERPLCAAGEIDFDPLVLANWPDYMPPEVIAGFERRYGITVRVVTYESNEEILSAVQARADNFDVIVPSDYMVDIMRKDGLLLPLDPIALPGRLNLDPLFDDVPYDPDGTFSVPYLWGTIGLGVNTNVVPVGVEPSWGLIFDPQRSVDFAGRVSLLDEPRQALAAALMYLGFSPNSRKADEIEAAAAVVGIAKQHLAGFQSDGYADDLVDGALDVAHGRSDAFFQAFTPGTSDYRYLIPVEGTLAWIDNFVIPVTSTAACTAHAFIDWVLEARNGADLANYTGYASPNVEAYPFLDPNLLSNPAIYPPESARDRLEFLVDVGDSEIIYVDAFFKAKGS